MGALLRQCVFGWYQPYAEADHAAAVRGVTEAKNKLRELEADSCRQDDLLDQHLEAYPKLPRNATKQDKKKFEQECWHWRLEERDHEEELARIAERIERAKVAVAEAEERLKEWED